MKFSFASSSSSSYVVHMDDLDSSSPTGVLENFLRSVGSETSSENPTSSVSHANRDSRSIWKGAIRLFRSRTLTVFNPLNFLKISSRNGMKESVFLDSSMVKSPWKNFTLSELQIATNHFSNENLIGMGGYAEVYKGRLVDGPLIAIKRLIRGTLDDRTKEFLSEFGIMAHVNHLNIVRLLGYCIEGGLALVLEFSLGGNLASLLHNSKSKVGWPIRLKIALGTADGLRYLHEGCQRRIIHRDIKAANILLTEDFEPQICDFGLAKWLPEQLTHQITSGFEGTFGYFAPEYLMHGIIDEKTDVFAFGVLLLELVTGRRALDYSQRSLVLWAKPLLKKNKTRELIDPSLVEDYDRQEMSIMVACASICVRRTPILRPRMSQVAEILRGNKSTLEGLILS